MAFQASTSDLASPRSVGSSQTLLILFHKCAKGPFTYQLTLFLALGRTIVLTMYQKLLFQSIDATVKKQGGTFLLLVCIVLNLRLNILLLNI